MWTGGIKSMWSSSKHWTRIKQSQQKLHKKGRRGAASYPSRVFMRSYTDVSSKIRTFSNYVGLLFQIYGGKGLVSQKNTWQVRSSLSGDQVNVVNFMYLSKIQITHLGHGACAVSVSTSVHWPHLPGVGFVTGCQSYLWSNIRTPVKWLARGRCTHTHTNADCDITGTIRICQSGLKSRKAVTLRHIWPHITYTHKPTQQALPCS